MASVSSVIGSRITVTRAGKEYKACCPFHNEKTPSFTINDTKGFYHCFGCGVHGDVIGFIAEYEKLSYREAIEQLASELGVTLPQPDVREQKREKRRLDLQEINDLACRWFEMQLQTTGGHRARTYLEQRGLSAETIQQFRLGFAPDDRQAIVKALAGHGVEVPDMVAAGLLAKNDRGETYSRFRGRIMFPITTPRGDVIAFGGRILDSNANPNAPKYLNSPETEVFHKGEQLYHYGPARHAAQEQALVICEGYMDVIALAQAGYHASVAPLGTAMTETQLRLCWAASDTPVLALDGDAAGERAMTRAADLALPMLQPSKSLKILTLPKGEDPDSFVKSQGLRAWRQAVEGARDLSELLWDRIAALPAQSPEQRAAQDQAADHLAQQIAHSGVQQHYRSYLRDRLRDARWQQGTTRKKTETRSAPRLPSLPDPQNTQALQQRVTLYFMGLCCACPALLAEAQSEHILTHTPLPAPWHAMGDWLLHWAAAQEDLHGEDMADSLKTALASRTGSTGWELFQRTYLPTASDPEHLQLLAKQLGQRWQYYAMLQEYQAFQRQVGTQMDDAAYRRMQALQREVLHFQQAAGALPDAWMQE